MKFNYDVEKYTDNEINNNFYQITELVNKYIDKQNEVIRGMKHLNKEIQSIKNKERSSTFMSERGEKIMKYYIQNNGCDDSTNVTIDLNDEEVKVFTRICRELNKKSSYQCQPRIALYKYDECQIEKSKYDEEEYINPYTAKNLLEEE